MVNNGTRLTMNRRTVLKATVATGALSVSGCLSSTEDDEEFRIGGPWEATGDPIQGGHMLRRLGVTEALVGVDYEANVTPELATEWESYDDARRWRFSLRDDVAFHDGMSLDATAVVESLQRVIGSEAFADVPIDSVDRIDNRIVEVKTSASFAPLLAHLSRNEAVILSPDAIEDGTVTKPISTGPFAIESLEPSTEVRTLRNEEYYGTVPTVESVRYEVVKDDQTRRFKLENRELEMARILPSAMVDQLELADGIDVYTFEIPRSRFLVFDTASPPFDDKRVRRAVNYAIDREAITDSILNGVDDPAIGPFPESLTEWANPDLEGYSHDPDRARALLSEAGWTADERDESGIRTRGGDELSIEFLTFSARSLPVIAEVLQDHLGQVGFDLDITTMEYGTMVDTIVQGPFDGYMTSWGTLWYPDPDRLTDMYHSDDSSLHHGYENPDVDTLLEEARECTDRDERMERYYEVQSIVLEDAPVAYITDYTNVVATTAGVSGYEPHPTELRYGLESIKLAEK